MECVAGSKLPGIFCLEGAWAKRLDDRTSVLPTLESLERLRLATYIHRDVGTEEELYHYLDKWAQAGYRQYGVLFFAFHGIRGSIKVGRGTVTLDDLAVRLDGKAASRIVYFGSCSVMKDRSGVANFQKATRAKLVCGYTKDVDWVESSAFDTILLSRLVEDLRIDARVNRLRARYPDLVTMLGFTNHPQFDRTAK